MCLGLNLYILTARHLWRVKRIWLLPESCYKGIRVQSLVSKLTEVWDRAQSLDQFRTLENFQKIWRLRCLTGPLLSSPVYLLIPQLSASLLNSLVVQRILCFEYFCLFKSSCWSLIPNIMILSDEFEVLFESSEKIRCSKQKQLFDTKSWPFSTPSIPFTIPSARELSGNMLSWKQRLCSQQMQKPWYLILDFQDYEKWPSNLYKFPRLRYCVR